MNETFDRHDPWIKTFRMLHFRISDQQAEEWENYIRRKLRNDTGEVTQAIEELAINPVSKGRHIKVMDIIRHIELKRKSISPSKKELCEHCKSGSIVYEYWQNSRTAYVMTLVDPADDELWKPRECAFPCPKCDLGRKLLGRWAATESERRSVAEQSCTLFDMAQAERDPF